MSEYVPEYKRQALKIEAAKGDKTTEWIVEKDPLKAGKQVCEVVTQLITDQQTRLFNAAKQMSMYSNTDILMQSGAASVSMPSMAYNLIKVCTDTLAGMLIQGNSRVVMNTVGGNWNDSQKARKTELAIEGEWSRMRFYREAAFMAIDAINTGTGFLKLFREKNRVSCERVFPNEVFVDEAEACYGPPTKMFQVRYLKKDTLMRLYPGKADIIAKATVGRPPNYPWISTAGDGLVQVCEAWALERRHIIAIDSGALLVEDYPYTTFPIIAFRAGLRPFGWYGQGFCEQVFQTQLVLNQTIAVMQEAADLGIAPYWVIQEGANINPKHLEGPLARVIETNSMDPKWVTNPPFHPDATAYVEQLAQIIYNFYGLNQMQTQGEVQTNRLDSRKALIEFQDIAATRHTALMERWEDFFIEAAKATVALCQQIAKSSGGYPVVAKKKYQVAIHLDWADLDMDGNAHVFTPAPSNLLSRTPAGKIQEISDMMEKGLISQAQGQRALRGAPDIDALVEESTALDDHISYIIAKMTDEEDYIGPDTYTTSPHTINRMRNARLEYIGRNAPQSVIKLFDQWVEQAVSDMKQKAAEEQQAQQAAQAEMQAQAQAQGAQPTGAVDAAGPGAVAPIPVQPAPSPSEQGTGGGEGSAAGIPA